MVQKGLSPPLPPLYPGPSFSLRLSPHLSPSPVHGLRLPRPSRSMHFGDVAPAGDVSRTQTSSDQVTRNAQAVRIKRFRSTRQIIRDQ